MDLPDLSTLTLAQLLATLLFFTVIDTLVAYAVALANGNFQAAYALDFLRTHVAKVAVPVAFLGVIGRGLPEVGIPAVPPVFGMAIAVLGVYILTVIASVRDSFADKAIAPTTTSAVAPVVDAAAPPAQGAGAV